MDIKSAASDVARRLQQAGYTAYFAGGCVRDEVLGAAPHDYDIATSALPTDVQKVFPKTLAVGAHFGVILVMDHGHTFEVATFRSDHEYVDGRRPTAVTFSTPQEDASRRDFICSLSCHRVAKARDLYHFFHVMNADNIRAVLDGDGRCRCRGESALFWRQIAQHFADG